MVIGLCDRCGEETRRTVTLSKPGGATLVSRCEDCQEAGDGRRGG